MTGVVAVLVIVVGVVVGILALEIEVVDADPHDVNAGILHALNGLPGVFATDLVKLVHEHGAIGVGSDDQWITHSGNRGTVKHDLLVFITNFLNEIDHAL